jgi:hypothetical protein
MVDQIVAVDEVISCARDVLPGNIISALLEFGWKSAHAFADDLDASLQCGRRLPICEKGVERMVGTQCPGLFGRVTNLRERDSRVTATHESS